MTPQTKFVLHALIGAVGYGVWALMAYLDVSLRHDFLVFNIGMATGTIGLALRDMKTAVDVPAADVPPAPSTPSINRQAGFARPIMLPLLALSMLTVLAACSLAPVRINALEEGVAQTAVQSSERTICRDIPIGTWLRLYGASVDRLRGWQSLCFNPVTAPLNAETIAAILKVYPGFVAPLTSPPVPDMSSTVLGIGAALQGGATVVPDVGDSK